MASDYFWSLKQEIEQEIHSFALSLSGIKEDDISEYQYRQLSQHADRIQDLFDRISEAIKDLDLDQSNPELYKLLEGKQDINSSYGFFKRQRSIFFKMFAKFRTPREEALGRERVLPEEPAEEPEEETPEELPEDELVLLDEEEFDPDEEKKQKQEERKARQKKLAAEAKKREEADRAQQLRQQEAAKLGVVQNPDKPISEADLRQERLRQDEERIRQEREAAERIQAENEALRKHREKMDQAAQFEHLENQHIDMSREGIGHSNSDSDEYKQNDNAANAGFVPFPGFGEPEKREGQTHPPEEPKQPSPTPEPAPQHKDTYVTPEPVAPQSPPAPGAQDYQDMHRSPEQQTHTGEPPTQTPPAPEYKDPSYTTHQEEPYKPQQQNSQNDEPVVQPVPGPAPEQPHTPPTGDTQTPPITGPLPQFQQDYKADVKQETGGPGTSGTTQQTEPFKVPQGDHKDEPHVTGQQPLTRHDPDSYISVGSPGGTPGFVPHQFTPGGAAPIAAASASVWTHTADSNAKIYSALMTNRTEGEKEPVTVSPAFETQMRYNLEQARMAYMDAKGTPSEAQASREYIQQRNAFAQYRSAVKKGHIQVEDPVSQKAPATSTGRGSISQSSPSQGAMAGAVVGTGAAAAVHSFTPYGTVGQTIENGRLTGNRYEYTNPGLKGKPAYTVKNPMVVSPQYEEALTQKMRSATENLDAAMKKGDLKAGTVDPLQMKMYTDAYLGFQNAKRAGTVVVSNDAKGADVPDYQAWQQRRIAQTAKASGAPLGVTGQSKGPIPNQTRKGPVDDGSANIFNWNSHLKQRSLASMYASQIGGHIQNWSYGAALRFSQQMYRVIQKGDDNALQTLEQGRYYITTAAGVALAIHAGAATKGLENRIANASAKEFNLYGTKSFISNSELSSNIKKGMRASRKLDDKIDILEKQMAPFKAKMDQYAAQYPGNPYVDKLAGLDPKSRAEFQKLSSQLDKLKADRASVNKDLKMHQGLQKLRHEAKLEQKILDKLKENGKLPKNPKALREAARKISQEQAANIEKNFGKFTFEEKGKKVPLHKATDASLAKEIKALQGHTKSLKSQINTLKAKGSTLSQAEKLSLAKLEAEFKELNKKLNLYKGLRNARGDLAFTNRKLDEIINGAFKNKQRYTNALYALQGFMIRPLQAGFESNTEGLARMVQIATNRYVHILVKASYKSSLFMTRMGMNMIAPGSGDAAALAINLAKTGVKAKVGVAKQTIKSAVKTTVKTTVQQAVPAAGRMISTAVPSGIKTRVRSTMSFVSKMKGKYDTVATGVKGVYVEAKKKFADSAVGKALSSVKRFKNQAAEAIKTALRTLKGFALKALAFGAGFFLILGIVSAIVGAVTGSIASSVIVSPDVGEDGKIDLSAYMDILAEEQADLDSEIYAYMSDSTYDNVYVNYSGPISNSKEILSMMAVRMTQDLDMDKNPEVEKYLRSLYQDSHTYTTEERQYQCSGCVTEEVPAMVWNPTFGEWEWDTEIDPDTGLEVYKYETITYCTGHVDLTVNISVLKFDEIFTADTYANEGKDANAGELIGNFKITHYCACMECCGKTDGITASGAKATAGRTIAVDPSVIPLGTHVIINGKEYVAEDTGGAINGNRIDIFMSSHKKALNAGVQYDVPVYYPSYEGSSFEETGRWDGWTEQNIEWAKLIYGMPWTETYTGYYEFGAISSGGTSGPAGPEFIPVDGNFTWPVPGYTNITSPFGYRGDIGIEGASTYHKGIDIGTPIGTPVYSTAAGTIVTSQWDPYGGGNYVKIDHGGGVVSKYLHLNNAVVNVGDVVEAGQLVAYSGDTGIGAAHLDFRIEINGTAVNPLYYVSPH